MVYERRINLENRGSFENKKYWRREMEGYEPYRQAKWENRTVYDYPQTN